jgi:hypothetical protein
VNAQWLVRLSAPGLRTAPKLSPAAATSLDAMKDRFPSDRRPAWRQRFLAIARELESAPPRRNPVEAMQAVRRPLLAGRSLRGVRLGCIRAG